MLHVFIDALSFILTIYIHNAITRWIFVQLSKFPCMSLGKMIMKGISVTILKTFWFVSFHKNVWNVYYCLFPSGTPDWHAWEFVQRFNYINTEFPKIWMKFRVLSLAVKGFKWQSVSSDNNILLYYVTQSVHIQDL